MAKKLNDYEVRESVSPYVKAVDATGSDMDPCRAVHMNGTSAEVTLTIDDTDIGIYLVQGRTYQISATKSSSTDVVFLY